MAKATFTAKWVESVKSIEQGQVDYFDTKPPGIGLRISNSGRKTWFVMYRSSGRLRRLTLGTYPTLSLADAREQATAAKRTVAQGADPAVQKQSARLAPTVAELATQYIWSAMPRATRKAGVTTLACSTVTCCQIGDVAKRMTLPGRTCCRC